MSEYTKGPWKAKGRWVGTSGHMSYIAECRDQNGNWSDEPMSLANATFIAAAPDMYAALEAAEQILKRSPSISTNDNGNFRGITTESTLKEVRCALAKAEGRE